MSDHSDSDEVADAAHFEDVVLGFRYYLMHSMTIHNRLIRDFVALPPAHKAMLKDTVKYPEKLRALRHAVEANAKFLNAVIGDIDLFGQGANVGGGGDRQPSSDSIDKVHSTLRQYVRDWAVEGTAERDRCYAPVIEEVARQFPLNQDTEVNKYRVLVPGCGLGRLVWEFAHRGYAVQGNEFSYQMLLGSNWVLNRSNGVGTAVIHPYAVLGCNRVKNADQFAAVSIPDVHTSDLPEGVDMSMNAGEFVAIYSHEDFREHFNVVAGVFFVDTAHNVIDYLECIWKTLKPGGIWINLGPLLWHYSDQQDQHQVELSLEEVLALARHVGFQVDLKDTISASYTSDSTSMMHTVYSCAHWVAKKPAE